MKGSADDLLAFVAVVRAGGFTKGASSLGISKQLVSNRIASLERRLGVRLLERTTRSVRTTDTGAAFYERAQRIAGEIDEAEREARDLQSHPTGVLRVSAPHLFGRRFLAPVVATYLRAFPDVRVELVLADRRSNLVEEGFDLAIRVGPLDDSSLTARRLGSVRVSIVASRAFVRAHPMASAGDLDHGATIGFRPVEEWIIAGKKHRVRPRLVVNDLEIACDSALAGLGVASLPELVTGPLLKRGELRRVFPADDVLAPVHAVYPSRELLSSKVRSFVDALVQARLLR